MPTARLAGVSGGAIPLHNRARLIQPCTVEIPASSATGPKRVKRRIGVAGDRYRHELTWGYVKRRKKPSFSPPGPAPSGVPPLEQKRIRGARYREKLAARGLVELHLLAAPGTVDRFRELARNRNLTRGELLAELIGQCLDGTGTAATEAALTEPASQSGTPC